MRVLASGAVCPTAKIDSQKFSSFEKYFFGGHLVSPPPISGPRSLIGVLDFVQSSTICGVNSADANPLKSESSRQFCTSIAKRGSEPLRLHLLEF